MHISNPYQSQFSTQRGWFTMENIELTEVETKTLNRMNIRKVAQYLVALGGLVWGLYELIFVWANDTSDLSTVTRGLCGIAIAVLAVFTFGPWTKAEKELDTKINPKDVESEEERVARVVKFASDRAEALRAGAAFFFVFSIWMGRLFESFGAFVVLFGVAVLTFAFSLIKTKNERSCMAIKKAADDRAELKSFRTYNLKGYNWVWSVDDIMFRKFSREKLDKNGKFVGRENDRMISFYYDGANHDQLESKCDIAKYGMFTVWKWDHYLILKVGNRAAKLYES